MKTHPTARHVTAHRVLLECLALHPGEVLRGVVEVSVNAPLRYSLLEVTIVGEEFTQLKSSFGNIFGNDSSNSLYYKQRILVAGSPGESSQMSLVSEDDLNLNDSGSAVWSSCKPSPSVSETDLAGIQSSGLVPGVYTFPFKVKLPSALPPSYEHHIQGSTSRLKYSVTATFLLKGCLLSKADAPLAVKVLPLDECCWHKAYLKTVPSFEGNVLLISDLDGNTEDERWASQRGSRGAKSICINHGMSLYAPDECDSSGDSVVDAGRHSPTSLPSLPRSVSRGQNGFGAAQPSVNNWLDASGRANASGGATEDPYSEHNTEEAPGAHSLARETAQETGLFEVVNSPADDRENGGDDDLGPDQAGRPDITSVLAANEHHGIEGAGNRAQVQDTFCQGVKWEHRLEVFIEGFFNKGTVAVTLSLERLVYTGGTFVTFHGLVDNKRGMSSVLRINFSLVTHYRMNSLIEYRSSTSVLSECSLRHVVKRKESGRIPLTSLEVPQEIPPTIITSHCSCRTFLVVEVFCSHGPGTRSGTAETELLIVHSTTPNSGGVPPRKGKWTNYFRAYDPLRMPPRVDIVSAYVLSGRINVVTSEVDDWNAERVGPRRSINPYRKLTKDIFRPQLNFESATYYPCEVAGRNALGVNPLTNLYRSDTISTTD